jgi:hypothetical protein
MKQGFVKASKRLSVEAVQNSGAGILPASYCFEPRRLEARATTHFSASTIQRFNPAA